MAKPAAGEHPHDLISYRDTGELSDLTVVVDGERELALHRFPLYIKSDYFRQRAAESRISLPAKFPGGAACFELVADFCYGKRIDIGPDNCVQLNAAAKLLGMSGRGNLAELTDRYVEEILRSGRHARSAGPVVELLAKATELADGDGDEAEADAAVKEIAERCFSALLDAWTRQLPYGSGGAVGERLLRLPLVWFTRLIGAAGGDSDRHRRALAELSARYLHRVFLRDDRLEKVKTESAEPSADTEEAAAEKPTEAKQEPVAETAGSDAEADETHELSTKQRRDDDYATASASGRRSWRRHPRDEDEDEERQDDRLFVPQEPASQVLDQVILALPESTPLAEVISADWIQRALRISEKFGCQCRGRLLQLAGNSLHKFRPEELHRMTSPMLCDIVGSSVRNKGVQPEVLACVIDNHLLDLAREGNLEADDFVKLAASVPAEFRDGHDTLYEVVETLMGSGKSIPDEQQQEIIGLVDLSRCDVDTLQRALEKGVVPAKTVCAAAIELARRLRQQLDSRTVGANSSSLRIRSKQWRQHQMGRLLLDRCRKAANLAESKPKICQSAFASLPTRIRLECHKLIRHGRAGIHPSCLDDLRSGSRFDRRPEPPAAGFQHRRHQPLSVSSVHVSGGSVGLGGGSSVHYADPYVGRGGYLYDDGYGEAAELSSDSRYSAQDYDVDLLLLEAERSAQQQQQQRPTNYPYYPSQYGRSRRW